MELRIGSANLTIRGSDRENQAARSRTLAASPVREKLFERGASAGSSSALLERVRDLLQDGVPHCPHVFVGRQARATLSVETIRLPLV